MMSGMGTLQQLDGKNMYRGEWKNDQPVSQITFVMDYEEYEGGFKDWRKWRQGKSVIHSCGGNVLVQEGI